MHRLLIALILLLPAAAVAAEPDLERAQDLRLQAKALRTEAEATFRAAEPACYERFLVNRCLDRAREARLERIGKARAMEIDASRIELAKKQRDALEAGRTGLDTRPAHETPVPIEAVGPESTAAAEAIRRAREAEAARAEAEAREALQRRDSERATDRAKAEAEAAERAEKAARDRERYDERIRKREAEKAAQ